MPLDEAILEILVCPKCKGELEYRAESTVEEAGEKAEGEALLCHACRLRYEIDDGIPIMLIDEAKPF